jgi:carbonyl reductase 1
MRKFVCCGANASLLFFSPDASVVQKTLQCNYYGTLQLTQSVLPLLKPASTSRIVNVSSMVGKLNKYSPALTSAFRNASSVSQVTNLMQSFQKSVEAGTHAADGWPSSAYAVSKAGVTGMTKAMAAEQKKQNSKILLNSCCPGYVQTDLTKGRGKKTPDQGALTPVTLALGGLGGTSGGFWEHEEVSRW